MGWFTKTVEVEKVVTKTLLGNAEKVTLYRAYIIEFIPCFYFPARCMKVLGYYHSCAQAFAEHPKADVDAVELWKVGDAYVKSLEVAEVKVQPKPKRAKGLARAA